MGQIIFKCLGLLFASACIPDLALPKEIVNDIREPEVRRLQAPSKTQTAVEPLAGGEFHVFTSATLTTSGLVGSYVNQNLRGVSAQDDWRVTQTIAGTRTDAPIEFTTDSWGSRSEVGLTNGSDADWELYSVQWDGYVQIVTPGTALATESDDSSRMWIDVDGNGIYGSVAPELVDNHWGSPQAPTLGPASIPLSPGVYRIRIQYEEDHFGNRMRLLSIPHAQVRVAYVVPSNRVPRPTATTQLQSWLVNIHSWYTDQMGRYGFGPLSFHYETEPDGITPKIHTVSVSETDAYLREDIWGHTLNAAAAAGVPVWNWREVWIVIPEIQVQQPDGSLLGGVALGAGFGNNAAAGVGMFGAHLLSQDLTAWLCDNQEYDGIVVPGIGPYPLVQDVSFAGFEHTTFSSITSSALGALAHELTHGFGLPHDGRNDDNFHGNLLGNGLRGIRGTLYPDLFWGDDTALGYGEALALRTNQFFAAPIVTDNPTPTLAVLTSGAVSPSQGRIAVAFQASDADGLSCALLVRDGELVGELDLEGLASGSFLISTPYYLQGNTNAFTVVALDMRGGRTEATTSLLPGGGARAPIPHGKVTRMQPHIGETVVLDASGSSDPDTPSSSLVAAWDLNNDNVFEIAPSSNLTRTTTFAAAGVRMVRVRVTDPQGNSSDSMPIPVLVRTGPTAVDGPTISQSRELIVTTSPSPFRRSTAVQFALDSNSSVSLDIFDVQGRRVRSSGSEVRGPGPHQLVWDGTDAQGRKSPSGIYFYRLRAGERRATGRLILTR